MTPNFEKLHKEISTPRLTLRIPSPHHRDSLAAAVHASLNELKPWLPWASEAYAENDAEEWIRCSVARFILGEGASYLLFERESEDVIGGVGAHDIQWKPRKTEIGYWLRSDRAGRGYMTEAVNALVEMLKDAGLRRIQLRADELNPRSGNVARRCGFDLEGLMRFDSTDRDGNPRSTHLFAKIV